MKKAAWVALLMISLYGCAIASHNEVWSSLIKSPDKLTIGCWDVTHWTGPSSPGHYKDFMGWGLKLNTVHPQFFATLKENGDLEKPGYQDNNHRGEYSINYDELIDVIKTINDGGLRPTVGLFIHNFESINERETEYFFNRLTCDLKVRGIKSIVLIPAWDIQGQWPAWSDGATRDCYIDPDIFNRQMKMIVSVRNKVKADNILIACAIAADYNNKSLNKHSKSAADYINGLKECDMIGINAYPTKKQGARWAFVNAKKLWIAAGEKIPVSFFEYSMETYDWSRKDSIEWSVNDKVHFINDTYTLLDEYPFVKEIHWWFIGKPTTATRISYSRDN